MKRNTNREITNDQGMSVKLLPDDKIFWIVKKHLKGLKSIFRKILVRKMKFTERKREIKLKRLLYQENLKGRYILYNYQHHHVSIKRETDYTYGKWRVRKFLKWKEKNMKN